MFRERIGVVVEGTFDKSQTFTSSRLMVNHSNEYRPPKPGRRAGQVEDHRLGTHGGGPMIVHHRDRPRPRAACLAAAFGAVVGIEGGLRHRAGALKIVLGAVTAFLVCMLGANLTMVYALVTHDFSVQYVSHVGSRATPLVYTIVSLWSALEGSILFWGAILAVYVFAFARAHRRDPPTNPLLALGDDARGGRLLLLPHRRPGQPVRPGDARCRPTGRARTRCCRTTS